MILCASSIFLNEILLYINDTECFGVISGNKGESSESISGLLNNITEGGVPTDNKDAVLQISNNYCKRKWIISLVTTPMLTPGWLSKHALSGEYYLFAEHDNLTSFIEPNSPFNSDSYRRKGPWVLYKPVMNYRLYNASRKDPLYCSNIGCTLKGDLVGYPLVWDYSKFGIPIVLAKGVFDGNRRFVYVGDSDPSGSFLAPYNPLWLRSLLGKPDYFRMIESIFIIVLAIYILNFKRGSIKFVVLSMLIFLFWGLNEQYVDTTPNVDVSISSTGPWLSPHYPSHYSSLPRNLVDQNLIVSVQRKISVAAIDIQIIERKGYQLKNELRNRKWDKKMYILLPGSSIVNINGDIISTDDLPLGRKEINLGKYQKKLIIEDARNLFINGRNSDTVISISENVYVIATNSPQKIQGIYDLIKGN
jgi:hypothetical protein